MKQGKCLELFKYNVIQKFVWIRHGKKFGPCWFSDTVGVL